ncbi:aspartyl-phosphate phosphatase Spo0E family protein [Bacillus sp. B190/17]|uniref:Aspartyl-phosphate phosphatase Spo0E family protein n=1 Tax=Bacillus lumedeiriae TaxID=3058829 RepID=A0ABW8I7P6_9BACI
MMNNETVNELMDQINTVRHLMISAGLSKGLTNDETIKYSEELDILINKYQLLALSSYAS